MFECGAGAFEVFAQFSRVLAFVSRRRRQLGRRPRRWRGLAQRRDLRLQARDLALQARDLLLQRGAVFRYRLARPADGVRTAERDLPGLIIEAQESAVDAVEGETAWRVGRDDGRRARGGLGIMGRLDRLRALAALRQCRRSRAGQQDGKGKRRVTHRDDPLNSCAGWISLPPARHGLNPSLAFSVDSITAVHATAPKEAENIAFNVLYQTLTP